jgi:hypothetical protein
MAWRSWSTTNRCPVCEGHAWAGRSAEQCRGGQVDFLPEVAYCSVRESSEKREKTWMWMLDRPYEWQPEPVDRDPVPVWERPATRAPQDLRHPDWQQGPAWDYQDEYGNYAYTVVRFDWRGEIPPPDGMRMKDYRPGRRFRSSMLYRWGLPAEVRVPYRLPGLNYQLERLGSAWIVEGEKSADALVALGHCATTMPGGSNSWHVGAPERWFPSDYPFSVIVDRDAAGRGWAADVLKTIPGGSLWQSATTNPGDDVVDHLEAGFGLDELIPMELP